MGSPEDLVLVFGGNDQLPAIGVAGGKGDYLPPETLDPLDLGEAARPAPVSHRDFLPEPLQGDVVVLRLVESGVPQPSGLRLWYSVLGGGLGLSLGRCLARIVFGGPDSLLWGSVPK